MPAPSASRRQIGPLSCIEFEEDCEGPVVVLFHGYGAGAADLAPLAVELSLRRRARWVFPDGPVPLPFGGLAWFDIDVESIERAQRTGRAIDWSGHRPQGLEAARETALRFLEALAVPWERLVLGGFSQGSMLAVDCALRAPRSPLACVILSGNLVDEESWRPLAAARSGLRFFQSHGLVDPILGLPGARRLDELLRGSGWVGRLQTFEGGHAIPPEVLDGLSRFLDALPPVTGS